jgi:hypothetical protein
MKPAIQRKPRVDSGEEPPLRRLLKLSWEDREWCYNLTASKTQPEAREAIRERFGIWLPHNSSFSSFYRSHQASLTMRAKYQAAEAEADAAESWFAENSPDTAPAKRREKIIERITLKLAARDDLETLNEFLKRWHDEDKLDQKRDALALDREKFEALQLRASQADAAEKTTADTTLSPEEKARRYREIFGLA